MFSILGNLAKYRACWELPVASLKNQCQQEIQVISFFEKNTESQFWHSNLLTRCIWFFVKIRFRSTHLHNLYLQEASLTEVWQALSRTVSIEPFYAVVWMIWSLNKTKNEKKKRTNTPTTDKRWVSLSYRALGTQESDWFQGIACLWQWLSSTPCISAKCESTRSLLNWLKMRGLFCTLCCLKLYSCVSMSFAMCVSCQVGVYSNHTASTRVSEQKKKEN